MSRFKKHKQQALLTFVKLDEKVVLSLEVAAAASETSSAPSFRRRRWRVWLPGRSETQREHRPRLEEAGPDVVDDSHCNASTTDIVHRQRVLLTF